VLHVASCSSSSRQPAGTTSWCWCCCSLSQRSSSCSAMCGWACWSCLPSLSSELGGGLLVQLSIRLLLLSRHAACASPQQLLLAALHTNRALPRPAGSGAAAECNRKKVGAPAAC
jgi:hypothetical protein